MKQLIRRSAAVLAALAIGTGAIFAQVPMTAEQEKTLYTTLLQKSVAKPPPASFNASVGMDVPADVELYEMPGEVSIDSVRRYRFTVLLDEVVLVDPGTNKVVLVLRLPHE